jgi:RNA polymerase sigma factor (sigma-70 family)
MDDDFLLASLAEDVERHFPAFRAKYEEIVLRLIRDYPARLQDDPPKSDDFSRRSVQEVFERVMQELKVMPHTAISEWDPVYWLTATVKEVMERNYEASCIEEKYAEQARIRYLLHLLSENVLQHYEKFFAFYHTEVPRWVAPVLMPIIENSGDKSIVDECVQETFTKALVSLKSKSVQEIRDFPNLSGWLYVIARNEAFKRWHRYQREAIFRAPTYPQRGEDSEKREDILDQVPQEQFPEPEAILIRQVTNSEVQKWVTTLPEPYGIPVRLHYLEGHSIRAITEQLEKSEGVVKAWLSRGVDMLYKYYVVKERLEYDAQASIDVHNLRPVWRDTILLHCLSNYPLDQIAQDRSWSVQKTKQYLYRGVGVLYKRWTEAARKAQ